MKYLPKVRYIPLVLFCLFFLKVFYTGINTTDVAMMLVLATAAFLFEYKARDKELDEVHAELKRVEDRAVKLSEGILKEVSEDKKFIQTLNNSINGLKMGAVKKQTEIKF